MVTYTDANHHTVAAIINGLLKDGVNPFTEDYTFEVKDEAYAVSHEKDGICITHAEGYDEENIAAVIIAIMVISGVCCVSVNGQDVVYGTHIHPGKSKKHLRCLLATLLGVGVLGVLAYGFFKGVGK